jgi:twinkle protein
VDVRELSEKLKQQAKSVAVYLLPGGRENNREWEVGSICGEPGKSLKVCLSGSKQGIWSDFATGESGDLIDLWRQVKGVSLRQAITDIKSWLGIVDPKLERVGKKEYRRPQRPQNAKKITQQSPIMEYLTGERKLSIESLSAYKVAEIAEIGPYDSWKVKEPWKGPWIIFPYLRDDGLIACKYLHLERKDGKKQTFVESNCEPCLFGWQSIGENEREIVICEGEIDAITFHQYGFPALSVPFGGGGGNKQQWIDYEMVNLDRFDTIYLALDGDDAGQEGTREIINRLGKHRCRIVRLPHKDANECLMQGVKQSEIAECLSISDFVKPEELTSFQGLEQRIIQEFYPSGGKVPGFDPPWRKMPFRFRRSELSIWTGVNSHGKSLLLNYLMLTAMRQGERVCIASLEMPGEKTGVRLIRQITGTSSPSLNEIRGALEWLEMKAWIFNLVGTAKVQKLLEAFEFAYKRYGVRQFVVDSLMKCGLAEDDYNGQKALVETLCDFVNTTEAHIHLVAHARKHENEDYQVGKMDVKGTGAISDLAWNCFTVWRNKKKELALDEYRETGEITLMQKGDGRKSRPMTIEEVSSLPDAMLICDKSRNEEWEGKVRLYYDRQSMCYFDRPGM